MTGAAAPERLGIGLIGAGRVGCAVVSGLRAAGHGVVAVAEHSPANDQRAAERLPGVPVLPRADVVERSQLVVLAVPDDVLGDLVADVAGSEGWQVGQLVVHTAGRHGLAVLEPAARQGAIPLAIHPAMTFTGTSLDESRLDGVPCAITAPPLLAPVAEALVLELGGWAVEVDEAARPLYHAALVHAANHLVTLECQAAAMLEGAGVSEPLRYLRPLVHAAVDNVLNLAERALTGPAMRGDDETLTAHTVALATWAMQVPESERKRAVEAIASYARLSDATAALAAARPPRDP